MQCTIAQDVITLQKTMIGLAGQGKRIALVPTMGALHAGHMALIEAAKQFGDAVVVSIFVNPRQFGENDDFDKYPRALDNDIKKIDEAGGVVVYAPPVADMYPDGFSTIVSVGPLGQMLEGAFRPGFFEGVATVVSKLLLRVLPHAVIFGEKDYQQLCVVRRLVKDLDMPIAVTGVPTLREADGLAMSSRNAYLSAEERVIAPKLHAELQQIARRMEGGMGVAAATEEGKAALKAAGFRVDYLELRQSLTLDSLSEFQRPARLLAAAWLGKTRLIDNIPLEGS